MSNEPATIGQTVVVKSEDYFTFGVGIITLDDDYPVVEVFVGEDRADPPNENGTVIVIVDPPEVLNDAMVLGEGLGGADGAPYATVTGGAIMFVGDSKTFRSVGGGTTQVAFLSDAALHVFAGVTGYK